MDSITFKKWILGFAFLSGFVPLGATAGESCLAKTGETVYSARFKKSLGQDAGWKLVVTRSKAWIRQDGKSSCQAECTVKGYDEEGPELRPTIRMSCRSTGLAALKSEATLILPARGEKVHAPMLRFGTWLTGYQRIPLRVEVDRLRQTLFAPKLARVAGHTVSVR